MELPENDDRVITLADARACFGGCIPGWKLFAENNNLNWVTVVRNGLKASELLATNDAMAERLVRWKYGQG